MDKYDKEILQALQEDATLSVAQLAEQVSLSKTACWHRIQKLESTGIIRKRVAIVDPKKLNLGLTAYLMIRTNRHDQDWLDKFATVVADMPEILEIQRLSGEVDYLLRAVVPDMEGYDRLYKKLITGIDLSDVSSSFAMETIKSTTALPLEHL